MKNNSKKYIISFFLVLLCTLQVSAADYSGSGTSSDPYLIQTLADLKTFAKKVYDGTSYEGKYFKQTTDIVVNENVIKSDGTFNEADKAKFTNWKPAGRIYGIWSSNSFQGNYDGGNHSISGLYFGDDLDEPYVGLFGYAQKAIIQNVIVKDSYMGCKAAGSYNDNYHGFLVGIAKCCTILNCHVSNSVMNVIANRKVTCGGVVGFLSSDYGTCAMKKCSFSGKIDVLSQSDNVYVGGLIGLHRYYSSGSYTYIANVEDCSVEGTLNLRVDFSVSCKNYYLSGLFGGYGVDMENCVNRMNFNVSSVNFPECFQYEGQHPEDVDYRSKYKHLANLSIYPMCESIHNMVNCANFGDVSIGTSNKLGPVDDIVVAPVGYIGKSMKSCAFYGLTKVGDNGYLYNGNPQADWGYWHNLFNLKIYAVAPEVESSATIKNVLRREDGSSYSAKDGSLNTKEEIVYYLQNNLPSGVTLYKTTGLADIIKDAQTIINKFTGYDEADKRTYKWGLLIDDETFMACPVPTVFGGVETGLVGEGTEANPYLIQDVRDYKFAVAYINSMETTNKMYKLLADIDMSNAGQIEAIGTTDHPFAGIFDGNGHAIIGLNAKTGSMFGQVKNGTVRDLTLLDMTCNGVDNCYPLVNTLTSETQEGAIVNCYVGGNINVNLTHTAEEVAKNCYMVGLCGTCKGGIIQDSYFKGNFNVTYNTEDCYFRLFVAGLCYSIAANGAIKSIISNNYSIFNVNGIKDEYCYVEKAYGITCADNTLGEDVLQSFEKVYFMTDCENVDTKNGIRATSYADIKMGQTSSFIEGVYNPVLPYTKSYKLEDGRGLDAILVDGEGTGDNANVILHYVPSAGEDYQSDRYLWQHPNLAVYNADDDAEYLINCNLDNAKDLQLNMDKAKSQTIKANMHYPVSIYSDWDNKPLLQMLCLPVTVQRNALPEGSKLKIVGTKSYDTTNNYFISTMVECDSVPAGVPFLLEIPAEATSVNKKATYDIVLRGTVATEPVSKIKVGDLSMETELKGTYVSYKKPNQFTYRDECEAKDGYYDVYKYDNTVSPFHAYAVVEGETSSYNYEYRLVDNLLLDEQSNNVASMLDTYNGKTADVILKRSMKKDVWNTVCLPFDMSAAEIAKAFGTGTIVEELARVENTDGATIVFATTSDMKAGKTYLVKPAQNGSLYNLADRTITNVLASEPDDATYDTYFKGTYAPILLEGTAAQTGDGYSYNYFIQSNKLYYLPEGQAVAMKGFRGWILIASNSLFGTDGNATNAKLMHCDGSTTDVRAIEYGTTANGTRIYNLQGIEHQEMQKGVNIIGGKKIMK